MCSSFRPSRFSSINARLFRELRHFLLLPVSLPSSSHGLVSLMLIHPSGDSSHWVHYFLPTLSPTACHHRRGPNSLRIQARPDSPGPGPLLRQRRFGVELDQDFPVPSYHGHLRWIHRKLRIYWVLWCQPNSSPLASPLLHSLGPQLPCDSAAVHGLAC